MSGALNFTATGTISTTIPILIALVALGLDWWAPGPLRRLQARIGTSEGERPPAGAALPPVPGGGRPAASSGRQP
ncbi:MAG: hypothetical protein ABR511_09170 [Acidimicrobiales bacterium]